MEKFTIQSYSYNELGFEIRSEIAKFLDLVWPTTDPQALMPNEMPVSHRPELSAQSFCCYDGNKMVGYAAIIYNEIVHCENKFIMAGLSCVATHPDYRSRGIGKKIVTVATQYLASQNVVDFGIFTCHPNLADFYRKAGDWQISPDIVLIGSHDNEALSSKNLNVVVMMRIFSEKGFASRNLFRSEPISLEFPAGEFI